MLEQALLLLQKAVFAERPSCKRKFWWVQPHTDTNTLSCVCLFTFAVTAVVLVGCVRFASLVACGLLATRMLYISAWT